MARLPTVGGDENNWGTILNEFLGVSHSSDGTIKNTVINVKDYGAVGDGTTDDTAEIQAAIDASAEFNTIYFPPGTYIVSSTIVLKEMRRYVGSHRHAYIKQADGANLNAVLASQTWVSTSSLFSNSPIFIEHLGVDGNKANQSGGNGHGIALISYWNSLNNIEIKNTYGTGLYLSASRQDGTEISNTAVETHIFRVDVREANGYGIQVNDPTPATNALSDGWIVDSIVQNCTEDAIRIATAAGWVVNGNHIYGAQKSAIHLSRPSFTRVIGNYIETYGSSSTAGTYGGIILGDGSTTFIGAAGASTIVGNTIRYSGGAAAGSNIRGIAAVTSSGVTGQLVITGNGLYGATHTNTSRGIRVGNQGATATTQAIIANNLLDGWDVDNSHNINSGTMTINPGDFYRTDLATDTTEGFGLLPAMAGSPTGTPADTTSGIPAVVDTSNNRIYVYVGGTWRYASLT